MWEHSLFWFLFPRVVEIAMSAVGISTTALLFVKTSGTELVTGDEQ
jgi:hypothetical protein